MLALVATVMLGVSAWIESLEAVGTPGAGVGSRGAPPTGPAPRLPSGKPDLNGVWMPPYVPDMTRSGRGQLGHAEPPFTPIDTPQARQALYERGQRSELPFTPAGLEDWKTYDAANGDYTGSCLPFGLPRSVNAPYPFQLIQTDATVAFLFEIGNWFHPVSMGTEHPRNPNPTWFGHSVGRWDGDTLVIDTVGFNGYTRLDTIGHPHSDALHLVQTLHRTDADHIAYVMTVEDPKTYEKPWRNERTFTLLEGPLIEYSCEENNKSLWEGRIKPWTPPWVQKPAK